MSQISIVDLEVFYCVGVTDEERAKPQRLLVSVEMAYDFSSAILSDRIEKTINYWDVAQTLLKFGERRTWKLIEKLASNIADMVFVEYTGLKQWRWRSRSSPFPRLGMFLLN